VELSDENGPVRALSSGHHFGERELLQKLKRQFNATALEPTTLLSLDKDTFDALAQNSLALGYLLSRSSVQDLTLEERKVIVNRASTELRQKQVADFMRTNPVVVHETDSVMSALKTFKQRCCRS
jgi:NADH dehydrogenase